MEEMILKAARELGIEPKVRIMSSSTVDPLVQVIDGTHVVQRHLPARYFMDHSLTYVKQLLSDMHRRAANN